MTRTIPRFLLLVGLLLAGCSRSADPLDWKIEGAHLGDMQESLDGIIASLPPDLRKEFTICLNNVVADSLTNRSGTLQDQDNRLSRRLRDKTVREILIEGNWLAYRATTSRLARESDTLLAVIGQSDQYPEAQREIVAKWIEGRRAGIDYLMQAAGKTDRRLTALWATRHTP